MLDSHDEIVSDSNAPIQPSPDSSVKAQSPSDTDATTRSSSDSSATTLSPDSTALDIKVQPADAILKTVPLKDSEKASARRASPIFRRFLRYGARTMAVFCLCGLAWVGGAYYSRGRSPLDVLKRNGASAVLQGSERDELVSAVRQMTEEIRALKTSVEGLGVAQEAGATNAKNGESLKNQLDSVQTETKTAIASLAGQVDKLGAESTTKLSQVNEQLASIEQQIAAPRAALASRGQPPHKHEHPHDAFDPSRDPAAPGAPRELGGFANSSPIGQKTH
jgi:hypothetical protein